MSFLDLFKKKDNTYTPFEIIETKKGSYEKYQSKLLNSSLILLIIGKRGSGKTAFGMKLMELFNKKSKRKCYILGFEKAKLPWFLKKIDDIEKIPNNSIALLDEGAVM